MNVLVLRSDDPATPEIDFCPLIRRKGHVYRGLTEGEWQSIRKTGVVLSDQRYSTPDEGTCFAEEPATAESYVNFGRDDPRRTRRCTYMIEVPARFTTRDPRDGYWKARQAIPREAITRAWKMCPVSRDVIAGEEIVP